ncbi:hypothetical protein GGR32_002388 [Mesonia hippocampi]|uniref:DegT/DnrJ/EryC1/StrS aminotransferase family protein n=1 Tax=Mesonia hippocampi TaxID=1628250 RepID=A0A840EWX4_9FLAO|nr:hypothetical protein [Mesonia hippocampi]MBB4120076.1 hypothetical protein [Mesonia hippocampi]
MIKRNSIGGYFSLELTNNKKYHSGDNFVELNSARNCLEYILISKQYSKIYIPYYTCEVILEPINKTRVNYEFYDLDNNLEPIFDFNRIDKKEAFLLTNYFGLKDEYILKIHQRVKNLIIDNAQSFFSEAIQGIDTFYSPRKFFGLPDGGILYTDKKLSESFPIDVSYNRASHLLKRLDLSAEEAYEDFRLNDESLDNQPIKFMSNLTKKMLNSIDFDYVKGKRCENFNYLHKELSGVNLFSSFKVSEKSVPMVYPFRTKNPKLKSKLLKNKIYCATYWSNVLDWSNPTSNSYNLVGELIPLPIDQRYDKKELDRIIEIII